MKDKLAIQKRYEKTEKGKECKRRYFKSKKGHLARSRYYQKLKSKVFVLLGGKCSNPNCLVPNGCSDPRCLQIDHVHGGGNKERKGRGNEVLYLKILLNPEGYQLLCANCNWIKRYENKEVNQYSYH